MDVTWRLSTGERLEHRTSVDADRCITITPDDGDLSASVAKEIVTLEAKAMSWLEFADGNGPAIEILDPSEHRGFFAVAMSRGTRGGAPAFHAHRLVTPTDERARLTERLLRQATDPADVEKAYSMMGNRYGHEIAPNLLSFDDIKRIGEKRILDIALECDALQAQYDNATLHDMGWPALCRLTWKTGVLIDCVDGAVPEFEAREEFSRQHGLVIQPVSQWYGDTVDFAVCFVPFERLDDARSIEEALRDAMTEATSNRLTS